MRMKSVMLLAIAAGCGLVAMVLFQQVMNRQVAAEVEQKALILVAKTEISPGTKLDENNTEFKEFPTAVLPPNPIMKKEDYAERALKVRAMPGDIVTLDKLSRKGQHGATNDIPAGLVAVTIAVDASQASAGLLQAGDRVDVMVSYRNLNQHGLGKEIKTVLEYVEVFAIDKTREASVNNDASAPKTITLLVTPEKGKLLNLAGEVGKLHLAMRSKEDSKPRVAEKDKFLPEEADAVRAIAQLESGEGDIPKSDQSRIQDGLKMFLDAQQRAAAQAAAKKEEVDLEPVAPKWSVEIFAGDQRREDVVELQDDDLPADFVKQKKAWQARQQKRQQPKSTNPLVSGIKSLFGGPEMPEAEPISVQEASAPN